MVEIVEGIQSGWPMRNELFLHHGDIRKHVHIRWVSFGLMESYLWFKGIAFHLWILLVTIVSFNFENLVAVGPWIWKWSYFWVILGWDSCCVANLCFVLYGLITICMRTFYIFGEANSPWRFVLGMASLADEKVDFFVFAVFGLGVGFH